MATEREIEKRSTDDKSALFRLVVSPTSIKLLLGGVLVFVLGVLVGFQSRPSHEEKATDLMKAQPLPVDEKVAEFHKAIQAEKDAIDKRDFQTAHDFILAASLLQPKSGELVDAVLNFIETAAACEGEEARILAEDLLSRREGLIAYQPVPAIPAARSRFEDAAKRLAAQDLPLPATATDPVEPIEKLVEQAGNEEQSLEFRTRACEAARNAISDLRFTLARDPKSDASQELLKRLDVVEAQVNRLDQECIALEYQPIGQKADAWISTTNKLLGEIKGWKDGKRDEAKVEGLKREIQTGSELLRELTAYSKLGVAPASQALQKAEALIEATQRAINWAYNVQILSLVRELEGDNKTHPVDKIGRLAVVREEELAPEILRRHNALWDKMYGELPQDQQVTAIRMRILRTNK